MAPGVCGRPFLVGGEPLVAPATVRADWTTPLAPNVASLAPEARRLLFEHYSAMALMEHASIAAFARFSLDLLALGAPPELVRRATDALREETEHATLCFGLASAYGDGPVGPGALAVAGAVAGASIEETVRTAFLEACIGETCAAVEAAEAAARAEDPVVASVLGRISADETRHAELGWAFATWALGSMDPTARLAVERDLVAAVERERSGGRDVLERSSPRDPDLQAHGLLPTSVRNALRTATIQEAVAPCLRALLASFASTHEGRPSPVPVG